MEGVKIIMEFVPNKLKRILNGGKVAFGSCMCAFSPNLVEIAGYCGLDFCRIDNEHAWRQDDMLEHMMRAAVIADITTLVRVDKGNPYLIRKALEIGAGGIIIPNIKNSDEVKSVVKAAKFPPLGDRGISSNCFSARYGTMPEGEWINWSNKEALIGVMVETREALYNIEEIMTVEGLDFVLFGPADYAMSIGLAMPDIKNQKVQDAIKVTIEAAKKNGKHIMISVGFPWEEEAKKYINMGCNIIEIGNDYSILRKFWQKILKKFIE